MMAIIILISMIKVKMIPPNRIVEVEKLFLAAHRLVPITPSRPTPSQSEMGRNFNFKFRIKKL